MEGDSNLACFTYENVVLKEDMWAENDSIWLMGKKFSMPEEKDSFLEYARTRFWFTYRKGFDAIGGTGPTSDSGWGCMLRCGQMLLAQTFLRLKLNSKWKWRSDEAQNSTYYKILKGFADDRSSCYSIHQIAQMGVQEGKSIGEWFGPNTVAQALKRLATFDVTNDIAIYVAMDNTVCKQDVESLCKVTPDATGTSTMPDLWKPLLLIIPLRLGLSDINPLYFTDIKTCFAWDESVGMIGGKPNHAYYFIGCSEEHQMIFLDPHTTQPSVSWNHDTLDPTFDSSYHCESPSTMSMAQLDPSLAIGFFCEDKKSFESFCTKAKGQGNKREALALFSVVDKLPKCNIVESKVVSVSVHNRDKIRSGNQVWDENACLTLDSDEDLDDVDEEFEILEVS